MATSLTSSTLKGAILTQKTNKTSKHIFSNSKINFSSVQKPAVTTRGIYILVFYFSKNKNIIIKGVLCRANVQKKDLLKPTLLTSIPTILAANPALAEVKIYYIKNFKKKFKVGSRMNGDGTALPLGINDPVLLAVVLLTFGGVWAFYASAAKNLGGGENEDSGLSL